MDDTERLWQAPTYDGSVFISYARSDDEKFPLDPNAAGWVSFFWDLLRFALTDAGLLSCCSAVEWLNVPSPGLSAFADWSGIMSAMPVQWAVQDLSVGMA
jgi:hypothetical protein